MLAIVYTKDVEVVVVDGKVAHLTFTQGTRFFILLQTCN